MATKTKSNGNGQPAGDSRPTVESMTANAREILKVMRPELYRRAYEQGISFSAWLELQDPSRDHGSAAGDAFGRLLMAAGIRTKSVLSAGITASPYEAFMKNEQTRALVPEWISRQWREVAHGHADYRAILLSSDGIIGSFERPYAEASTPRWENRIEPAIPLSSIIATTTAITGDSYRSYYLDFDQDQVRFVRVGETAEVPRAELKSAEHTVDLYKFGRAMEASYEVLRRQPIDRIALFIQLLAAQTEADKLGAVLDVVINGDGNAGTAAEVLALTTLDTGAVAGTLTLRGWLKFKAQFRNPYALTTVLAQEDPIIDLKLLDIGTANVPLYNVPATAGFGAINDISNRTAGAVDVGIVDNAPADQLVGFDRRFEVERLVEIGANIEEIERYVTRQTQVLVMTEVEGYNVLDNSAAKILNIAA